MARLAGLPEEVIAGRELLVELEGTHSGGGEGLGRRADTGPPRSRPGISFPSSPWSTRWWLDCVSWTWGPDAPGGLEPVGSLRAGGSRERKEGGMIIMNGSRQRLAATSEPARSGSGCPVSLQPSAPLLSASSCWGVGSGGRGRPTPLTGRSPSNTPSGPLGCRRGG